MDYSLAALKLMCSRLKYARETPSQNALTLGGILFQRAWLQGVLVWISPDGGRLLLDDATGVIELHLSADFRLRPWNIGMYVMVVGGYVFRTGESPMIKFFCKKKEHWKHWSYVLLRKHKELKVHKIVDLSPFPDREAMWYLEVIEAYKLFYEPLIEDFI